APVTSVVPGPSRVLTPCLPSGQIECVFVLCRCASFPPGCAPVRPSAAAPGALKGCVGPTASRLRRANMGEGPATVRHKKTRYYAAIAAATVLGAGVAVATTVPGAT